MFIPSLVRWYSDFSKTLQHYSTSGGAQTDILGFTIDIFVYR